MKSLGRKGLAIIGGWIVSAFVIFQMLGALTAEYPVDGDNHHAEAGSGDLTRRLEESIISEKAEKVSHLPESLRHRWEQTRQFLLSGERRPIRFPHLHKVGGTTFCKTAMKTKEKVGKGGTCNSPKDNAQALIGQSKVAVEFAKRNCELRWERLHQFSFIALETFLEEETCPRMFHYVTIIRPPLDRIRSHLNSHQMKANETVDWLHGGKTPSVRHKFGRKVAFYDNYYIRFLLGPDTFFLPPFSITRDHLEKAKRKLEDTFAVVVPLYHQESVEECLQTVLRWKNVNLGHSNQGKSRLGQDAKSLQYLDELNALDVELYKYALEIAASCRTHLVNHVNRYFRNETSQ
eukprot:gb/GECG01002678.1/.p1 GENE.gb/GECG01002678.1/~~gb/GECG01002678.1/.p1  ORF type:complete len:348 (+),score=31.51 gb/GECG01002678.1/:1-1044(+)